MIDIHIPPAALEAGARAAMRAVELEHGSPEGRKLLGFDTSAAFIDAGWPNYVEQTRTAFVAMVEAWEGMDTIMLPRMMQPGHFVPQDYIRLPLTEKQDDKAR